MLLLCKCWVWSALQLIQSLTFEAQQRIQDPARGSQGLIHDLERRLGLEPGLSNVVIRRCAACICLDRECTPACVFQSFFPGEVAYDSFVNVTKVFSRKTFKKVLLETDDPVVRKQIADSYVWEATYRLNHPVTGCHGRVVELRQQLPPS